MSSTMTSPDATAERVVAKHPVRGAIWGLLLGLGLAMYAILFAVIPFTDWVPLILVVLAGVAIGVAWAYLGPAKQPSSPPPAASPPAAAEPAESQPSAEHQDEDDLAVETADDSTAESTGEADGDDEPAVPPDAADAPDDLR